MRAVAPRCAIRHAKNGLCRFWGTPEPDDFPACEFAVVGSLVVGLAEMVQKMATPFVKVDLSDKARDFEFMVLDAGVPLLDQRGANYQILRKWLKGQVAEPELNGRLVSYYVRSDSGGRFEEVHCIPANEADFDGALRKEFENLVSRVQTASAKSRDEEAVLRVVRDELLSLSTQQKKRLRCCYLFKYRDQSNAWRLVWCVGYRRIDADPSPPHICRNCRQLYVRRATDPKCPHCHAVTDSKTASDRTLAKSGTADGKQGRSSSKFRLLRWLTVAGGVVAAALAYFCFRPANRIDDVNSAATGPRLVIAPETWTGPAGSRIDFSVKQVGPQGETDVGRSAVPQTSDPQVVSFDDLSLQARTKSPGKAVIDFHLGQLSQQATVTVEPPRNPDKLYLQPDTVNLGIGTTAQLKLIGEYEGARKVDLTDAAEWLPSADRIVFSYRGLLEGLEDGEGTVRVRYRATPESKPLEAVAKVNVAPHKYETLTLRLDPLVIEEGQVAEITAAVKPEQGPPLSITESSLLSLALVPSDAGTIQGHLFYAKQRGKVQINARFEGLEDTVAIEVGERKTAPTPLDVQPRALQLVVGEISELSITTRNSDPPVRVVSATPGVVHVAGTRRLVGRAEGSSKVEIIQGQEIVSVDVTVKQLAPRSISFVPSAVTVRVDDSTALRVIGELDNQKTFDVAPEMLDWISFPRPDYASLDKAALRVRGLRSTGDDREVLAVKFAGREARATLQVVSAPYRLELAPSGVVEIPAGQTKRLQVWAVYGDGQREEIAPDRIDWQWQPLAGISLAAGELHAAAAGIGPLKLSAALDGAVSNEIEVKTTDSLPLELRLAASPDELTVGQAGSLKLTATSADGPVSIAAREAEFESSDPGIVAIDRATGAFRAMRPGSVSVIATHPSASSAAETKVTVSADRPAPEKAQTKSVRIVSSQPLPVRLAVGAELKDYRVEATDETGATHDVTAATLDNLRFDGDEKDVPLALRDGKLVAVHPGDVLFTATYDGVDADEPLPIQVVADLEVDEIRLSPAALRLGVGESAGIAAEGFWKGHSIGMITGHPDLAWKAREAEAGVLEVSGPQVTGAKPGRAGVTAQIAAVIGPAAEVTVVEDVESIGDRLGVTPDSLQLQVGESRTIGDDIELSRGGIDFSEAAAVVPADPSIVAYQPVDRLLTGLAPGRTRVTYSAAGQLAHQDVEVVESEAPAKGSRIELEPGGGALAVGERVSVRAFQICDTCRQSRTGRTSALALTSSDSECCTAEGNVLTGLKPGMVEITARLPGLDEPARAKFTVVDSKVDRLAIVPPRIDVSLGQRRTFQVFAITPSGRRPIGDHPDLTLSLEGPEPNAIELNQKDRSVTGIAPGRAQLIARWREAGQAEIPVAVKGDSIRAIRLDPADSSVSVGETQDFQVFVQRGTTWLPLESTDGVKLRSSNGNLARVTHGLQVEARQAGTARLVANYQNSRAEARLDIKTADKPAAPPASAIGLKFIPDLFRLELGTPGDSIRIVRIHSDGKSEDVDHLAKVTIRDPQDVIQIEGSDSGPVVRPRRIGQTQVDAELDGLRTQTPLLVDVVAAIPRQARLRVQPNPVWIRAGESAAISLVQVVPSRGGQPIDVPYQLAASPSPVIEVDAARKSIRGLKGGNAVATVTVVDPGSGYDGLQATIPVEVNDGSGKKEEQPGDRPQQPDQQSEQPTEQSEEPTEAARLVLDGPTETTVGATIELHVERVDGATGTPLDAEASLSVPTTERSLADVRPGCKLIARQPGTVHVEARHRGMVSNAHEVKIRPAASEFQRLVLSVGAGPLAVGEVRPYELWGYPAGGEPRQDLTSRVVEDASDASQPHIGLTAVQPDAAATVVQLRAGEIVGVGSGRVRLQASIGGALRSNEVELAVAAEKGNQPIQLRVEPPRVVLREGERAPEFRVLVRSRGSATFREVDNARLESLDAKVLAPLPEQERGFSAAGPGETQLKVTLGDLTEVADVRVIPDRFRTIRSELVMGRRQFNLKLEVLSSPSAGGLEYRVTLPDSQDSSPWVTAARANDELKANLSTPSLALGPSSQIYRLVLESRDGTTNATERYPYSFQIKSDVVERKD